MATTTAVPLVLALRKQAVDVLDLHDTLLALDITIVVVLLVVLVGLWCCFMRQVADIFFKAMLITLIFYAALLATYVAVYAAKDILGEYPDWVEQTKSFASAGVAALQEMWAMAKR